MKCLMKQMVFGVLILFVIPIYTIGCVRPGGNTSTGTAQAEAIATGIVATMSAQAAETRSVELVMTHVAGTIEAMWANTQPGANEALTTETSETRVPLGAMQTSVAATVIAELTQATPPPGHSLLQVRVKNNVNVRSVNVRQGPDTCFAVEATLTKGRITTVLGRNAAFSWYQIELANGLIGWVWADYVELTDPSISEQVPLIRDVRACPTPSVAATVLIFSPTSQPPRATSPSPGATATSSTTTVGPTPTLPPTPTPPTCSYPPCGIPTTPPTPTPRDPYPYP